MPSDGARDDGNRLRSARSRRVLRSLRGFWRPPCCYRIDELSDGYNGPLIHNEGLFIGLEGV